MPNYDNDYAEDDYRAEHGWKIKPTESQLTFVSSSSASHRSGH
jgi:hypothetical protein